MSKIEVTRLPSDWKCLWLFPDKAPNPFTGVRTFEGITAWEWVRDYEAYSEDDYLEDEDDYLQRYDPETGEATV